MRTAEVSGMSERVIVGMSGGVDSSVAAWLLKKQGYDVIGVTMQLWQDAFYETREMQKKSCASQAAEDARRVAGQLGIPHQLVDFQEEFKKGVVDYFVEEYRCGRTPNPCIVCNRRIKWEALLGRGRELGADYIATGHYARILQLPGGRYTLRSSKTAEKDQTYALYQLTQEQLSHTLMPVGEYTKNEIRALAAEAGLTVADKPDSQEICFIPDQDYTGFIERRLGAVPPEGNFVRADGTVIGRHRGITHYTVGQRKGLGIALGHPVFVTELRPETNEVVIGEAEEVFTDTLFATRLNWMAVEGPGSAPLKARAKIRYNHRGADCTIFSDGSDRVKVVFDSPQRAVTPGQSVVFYSEDGYVLGGGTIL